MANLTDADKVLRNDTGKDIVTQLTAIKTAIENGGGGGGGASTVSQLTDVLLSSTIPDGDVLVRDNNLTGGKLWKNKTITVELTQAEYDQLVADDEVLPDVDYYIKDAPSMQGTSADLSYDGTTKSVYTKIGEVESDVAGIVESGSNSNGNYIKYADGSMICTKTIEFSVVTSEWQAWGVCYETALKDCGVWAMNFISSPIVSATQTGGAAWLEYFYDTDNTNVGKTRFVRPTVPGATAIYKMNIIGIGRWKA